jgi:hypothetical protein
MTEAQRRYRERHPDRIKAAKERYRLSGKATIAYRKWYHRVRKHNPVEQLKWRERSLINHYRREYGLTPEQAKSIKSEGCAICGVKSGRLNIDHDHDTGEVRGALCNPCNVAVGWFERAWKHRARILSYLKIGKED